MRKLPDDGGKVGDDRREDREGWAIRKRIGLGLKFYTESRGCRENRNGRESTERGFLTSL
jgi:hypothetical protein